MIPTIRAAGLFVLLLSGSLSQTPSATRTFEVASIRPHEGPMPRIGILTSGPRMNGNETVRGLIMYAYNLKNYQVESGPSYAAVGDTFYDVVAKAEGDTTPTRAEFRQMLQALLADRFKLTLRREMREMPVYALVLGKNGPKLKESAPDADPLAHLNAIGRNYVVTMPKASMDDIVGGITNSFLDRPVVDRTGLTGTYDVKMTYTPETRVNRQSGPDPNDLSIFTAVQAQLGLKLEPQKAMIEILIVDHVEKPTGN